MSPLPTESVPDAGPGCERYTLVSCETGAVLLCGSGASFFLMLKVSSGHQNQRPSAAAIAGVMKARTINVSTSRPNPIAMPNCPITRRSLTIIDAMVAANTMPAAVTAPPKAAE